MWNFRLRDGGLFGHLKWGYASYGCILKYLVVPSRSKPWVDLDPKPLFSHGHGPVWKAMATSVSREGCCAGNCGVPAAVGNSNVEVPCRF